MTFSCKSLNSSSNSVGFWIAIYSSILFTNTHSRSGSHHPVLGGIAALAVITLAVIVARFYCRTCKAA